MAKGSKFRIITLHNDGTQHNDVVEAPSYFCYFKLAVEVATGRIKSFIVTQA